MDQIDQTTRQTSQPDRRNRLNIPNRRNRPDRPNRPNSYLYVSGTSDTVRAHHAELAGTLAKHQRLASGDLVVEVASNDGSLLLRFQEIGVRTLGIEPAGNIAELARGRGVETLGSFFDSAVARGVRQKHGAARAVVANNVLAHVDDTVDFLLPSFWEFHSAPVDFIRGSLGVP